MISNISKSFLSSSGLSEKKKLKFVSSAYFSYKLGLNICALLLFSILLTFNVPSSFEPFLLTPKQYIALGLFPSALYPIRCLSCFDFSIVFSNGI